MALGPRVGAATSTEVCVLQTGNVAHLPACAFESQDERQLNWRLFSRVLIAKSLFSEFELWLNCLSALAQARSNDTFIGVIA